MRITYTLVYNEAGTANHFEMDNVEYQHYINEMEKHGLALREIHTDGRLTFQNTSPFGSIESFRDWNEVKGFLRAMKACGGKKNENY